MKSHALALAALTILLSPAVASGQGITNLAVGADSPMIAPGASGSHAIQISNNGTAVALGFRLTYVTPFYVNIDRGTPLPDGCELKLADPDPTIPEMVACQIASPIAPKAIVERRIPVTVTARARFTGQNRGMVMVAPTGPRPDPDLTDNWTLPRVTLVPPTPAIPASANLVDLWLTHNVVPLTPGEQANLSFQYGNKEPRPMLAPARLTVVTPFYVNAARDLPPACGHRLTEPDPLIPEVVVCDLGRLPAGHRSRFDVPVTLVPNGPRGQLYGGALLAPATTTDADAGQVDNQAGPGVLNIAHFPSPTDQPLP